MRKLLHEEQILAKEKIVSEIFYDLKEPLYGSYLVLK